MSKPAYPALSTLVPTAADERKIKQLELDDKASQRQKRAINYVGSPHCPDCSLKLKTKNAWSYTLEWIVQCQNLHAYLINAERGKDRLKFERIPDRDSRYPTRRKNTND